MIPDWMISLAHSLHGYMVTYTVAPCRLWLFLFMMAFISAWHTYAYLVSIASSFVLFLAQGRSLSLHPRGNPLYPTPMMTLSGPTMTAPTCLLGSLLRCAERNATDMK